MNELHQPSEVIEVIYTDVIGAAGEKGLFGDGVKRVTRIGVLDTGALSDGLAAVCNRLASAFEGISDAVREYELDGFDVQLEVTAKGEVRLIGSASTEVKGGVTLRFQRRPADRQQ